MRDPTATTKLRTSASLLGGLLSAFGATACCFGPLVLALLGAGGAWAGRLALLEPFQPGFAALTLIFLGMAGYRLYVKPRNCAEESSCHLPQGLRRQRVAFLAISCLCALMYVSPFLAPFFY